MKSTFPVKHFWALQASLREVMCGVDRNSESRERHRITIEVWGEHEAYCIKLENEEMVISSEAAYEMCDGALEIKHIIKSFLFDFKRFKTRLGKIQRAYRNIHHQIPLDEWKVISKKNFAML